MGARRGGNIPIRSAPVLHAIAVISGFNDFTMMCQPVQKGCGHLLVMEHLGSLSKGQIRCDNDRGQLIQLGSKVEQELAPVFREWQIAEFVQHNQIKA